jgi:probable AcnD-accessory protein PrpF
MRQHKIPAVYMRGGTSKGVFFKAEDLPTDSQKRDQILLRLLGSPDPYGKQIDGLGDASSTTNKVVLVSRSYREDCDIDYLCGQVAIDKPIIDWSRNFGNLSAAVAPFAISEDLCDAPFEGTATVRIWQASLGKKIIAHVPMRGGEVVEEGDFVEDGVAFPSARITLEFLDPAAEDLTTPENMAHGGLFPTGNPRDVLHYGGGESIEATMVDAGNPTVFVMAGAIGLSATEAKEQVDGDLDLLARLESIRAAAAVAMGLACTPEEATAKVPHRPKLAFIAESTAYRASNGKTVQPAEIDIVGRMISMGKLHHAFPGTGAIALAVAGVVPGTLVHRLVGHRPQPSPMRIGHTSGVIPVGAEASEASGGWRVTKAVMNRSARRLMAGWVYVPAKLI